MEKPKTSERIQDLVSETVDRISEVMDEFYEKATEILKGEKDSEKLEDMLDRIGKIRRDISEGTSDAIKNVTRVITDIGDSVAGLFKRDKDED